MIQVTLFAVSVLLAKNILSTQLSMGVHKLCTYCSLGGEATIFTQWPLTPIISVNPGSKSRYSYRLIDLPGLFLL